MATSAELKSIDKEALLKKSTDWKRVNILVTGKTGAGKSSLINAIIGKDIATVGNLLRGVTRNVTKYSTIVNGIQFDICNSPGFQDITEIPGDNEIIEKITTQLKQECTDIHLMVYCLRMDRDRIHSNDELAIKRLTDCFGPKIWEMSVIALTYSNKVDPPPDMDTDELAPIYFKDRQKEYKDEIIKILTKCQMDEQKASEIEVIPTGYHKPTRREPGDPYKLPDREDWFNLFWITCAERIEETALVPLYESQKDRIKIISENSPLQQQPADPESHQRLIYIKETSTLWLRIKSKIKSCVIL